MGIRDKLRQYLMNLCQIFGYSLMYVPSKAMTEYIFDKTINLSIVIWSCASLISSAVLIVTGAIIAKGADFNE